MERCAECASHSMIDGIARESCEKRRCQEPAEGGSYTLLNSIGYILYLPLFMAGPIVTFNNFVSQVRRPSPRVTVRGTAAYGVRLLASLLVIEVIMHYFYVVAIKNAKVWHSMDSTTMYSAEAFMTIAYWNLTVVWLKLLIIWRFFRFWALCDGIESTENMARCMINNYSMMGFWRSWHRSFNQWIVRYMYIPLGGSRLAYLNVWPIFAFVAVWHDVTLNLLAWSWLICIFLMPEIVVGRISVKLQLHKRPHYRTLRALAASASILFNMTANLVGYVVGLDGLWAIAASFGNLGGLLYTVRFSLGLYALANVIFEIRASERRMGILTNY